MSLYSEKQIIYINSNNRLSGTESDFYFNVTLAPNNNFNRVVVLYASISKSYYSVEVNLNTIELVEGASNMTISLPIDNYNRSSFGILVASSLTSASPSGWTYTVTYPVINVSVDTGFYTISIAGNAGRSHH